MPDRAYWVGELAAWNHGIEWLDHIYDVRKIDTEYSELYQ